MGNLAIAFITDKWFIQRYILSSELQPTFVSISFLKSSISSTWTILDSPLAAKLLEGCYSNLFDNDSEVVFIKLKTFFMAAIRTQICAAGRLFSFNGMQSRLSTIDMEISSR